MLKLSIVVMSTSAKIVDEYRIRKLKKKQRFRERVLNFDGLIKIPKYAILILHASNYDAFISYNNYMEINKEQSFKFEIQSSGNHVVFSLSSENIKIDRRNSKGSISSYNGPKDFKLHLIAKYINAEELWALRVNGFVKEATRIREIQKRFNF